MITAKNYAAQAMRGLENGVKNLIKRGLVNDAKIATAITNEIKQATHFTVPDGGRLLDTKDLRALVNISFRLPYPVTTIEYYHPISDCKRNLILAIEVPTATQRYVSDEDIANNETSVMVISICESDNVWLVSPVAMLFMEHPELDINNTAIKYYTFTLLPDCVKPMGDAEYEGYVSMSLDDAQPICDFIAALSCTNVGTETHQEAYRDNVKRISKGKLPIYETKTLTLNVTGGKKGGAPGGGSSTPKRQHFRRGYIRHLASGNYWVNACIVGKNRNGRIDKDYVVK